MSKNKKIFITLVCCVLVLGIIIAVSVVSCKGDKEDIESGSDSSSALTYSEALKDAENYENGMVDLTPGVSSRVVSQSQNISSVEYKLNIPSWCSENFTEYVEDRPAFIKGNDGLYARVYDCKDTKDVIFCVAEYTGSNGVPSNCLDSLNGMSEKRRASYMSTYISNVITSKLDFGTASNGVIQEYKDIEGAYYFEKSVLLRSEGYDNYYNHTYGLIYTNGDQPIAVFYVDKTENAEMYRSQIQKSLDEVAATMSVKFFVSNDY